MEMKIYLKLWQFDKGNKVIKIMEALETMLFSNFALISSFFLQELLKRMLTTENLLNNSQ